MSMKSIKCISSSRNEFPKNPKMAPLAKKLRETSAGDFAELDAKAVIKFRFGDSEIDVHPEFVHQNFDLAGKIIWPNEYLPLAIKVHVDTFHELKCTLSIEHGGDYDSITAQHLRGDLVRRMSFPCELSGGCKPASYPGDILKPAAQQIDKEAIDPATITNTPNGSSCYHYKSKMFQGRIFEAWRRAEWLMLWFIESVSQSEHECDPNWEYVILRSANGDIHAFCSMYRFPSFSFLDKGFIGDRIRLSQFLTVPSAWNTGVGSTLLICLADGILLRDDVDKLTMEDPSCGMSSLRESVYLRIAKEASVNPVAIPLEEIEKVLKVPRVFAKRIRDLSGIMRLLKSLPQGIDPVAALLDSGNVYVKRYIDSIEFFGDDDDDLAEPRPFGPEETDALVRQRLSESVSKLQRIMA